MNGSRFLKLPWTRTRSRPDPSDPMPEKPATSQTCVPTGLEISAPLYSINDKMLGAGEPLRVRSGQRILMHLLNAPALRKFIAVALPAHKFQVIALDGQSGAHDASAGQRD